MLHATWPFDLRAAPIAPVVAALAAAGCAPAPMSILAPDGPGAEAITRLWWVMFAGSGAILLASIGFALYATCRRPDRRLPAAPRGLLVVGGLAAPGVLLLALFVYGMRAGNALLPLPGEEALRIQVIGHQWWWEVVYPDAPGGPLHSANEVLMPAGTPIHFEVSSADVIHSFWAPRLGGKVDAVPGLVNKLKLQVDAPGRLRGQCSEFCGAQHARMAIAVMALEPAEFAQRLQRLAAAPARDDAGAPLFARHCAACHSLDPRVRGSGPNLADLAERPTLGAGAIANSSDGLRTWLREHRRLKPGNLMPAFDHLEPAAIEAIAAHLEGG